MNVKDVIFTILILTIIFAIGFLIYWSITEGGKCVASPLTYGAGKIAIQTMTEKRNIECYCSAEGAFGWIWFNKTNIEMNNNQYQLNLTDISK